MIIGIDIRALQTGHKYRGIGEVTKQVTNRLIQKIASQAEHEVVFFEYDDDDPKDLLDIPSSLNYRSVSQGIMPENNTERTKKEKLKDAYRALYGSPVYGSSGTDVFLQFDYAFGVPSDTKTILVKHDLIPLIFWEHFFESPWVPFKNYAARTTLRTIFANHKYTRVLNRSLKNASKIIAVSNSTKNDIQRFSSISAKKISVVPLGVDTKASKTDKITTSNYTKPTKPFLLFVGAADARRRVDDLVAAYNNLKAQGKDIQLVLAGENFQSPERIPNKIVRDEVLNSSYKDDILTIGYVDDATKKELFTGAIAFVYPTLYEGFGIPVLESMIFSCPVITYSNSSIPEVSGGHALLARDWSEIKDAVEKLQNMPKPDKVNMIDKARSHAEKYTWDATADGFYNIIMGR